MAGNVRAEMARAGLSQTALANRLGRAQTWLSRRLTGEVSWTVADLEDIADVLRTPLDVLIGAERASKAAG